MMMVMMEGGGGGAAAADDRAPGLLPPRKRLLAGLKQSALLPPLSSSVAPPALSLAPATTPIPIAIAMPSSSSGAAIAMASSSPACSSCGHSSSPLHRLPRIGSFHCTSCVLSSHKHMYCFLCLQLFDDHSSSPSSACITCCCKCHRLSHLQCSLNSWPSSFNAQNFSTALCIDCSRIDLFGQSSSMSGVGAAARIMPNNAIEPCSKKQRTGLDPERNGPKWAGFDLIPQTSLELALVDQEALAAAKVVAAIAEKEASDAKMRALATASAAAKAAARAKIALDNAYRVGQEESMAPDKDHHELVEEDAMSNRAAEGELKIQHHESTTNDQSRRQKSSNNVPRNSRSAAPVYKRRTLSAIVASEASRALANAAANRAISLATLKHQARKPRSNAPKRSGTTPEAAQARHQAQPSPNSQLPAMADESRAGNHEPPCSSQSTKSQDAPPPTSSLPSNLSQASFESNSQRWNVFEIPHPSHHETIPSFAPTATTAQDLNLAAEESPRGNHASKCMRNPREAERLSCLEASCNTLDDARLKKSSPIAALRTHTLSDVLKYHPPKHLPQEVRNSLRSHVMSSLSTQNIQFDDRFVKSSGLQSRHSPDTDLGRLEIVLPVVEAVEKGSRGLGFMASNYKAVDMDAYSDKATSCTPTCVPGRKFSELGKCCGAMKINHRDGSLHSREANCSMITDEQGKMRVSNAGMVSSCSVPLQAAAYAGVSSRGHS